MIDNQKSKKDYKKLWITILIVSTTTIICAYICGVGFVNFLNFPLVGTQDGWLSLFGALGGGVMTLFGVWWTIQDQDKKRKEELYLQYRPLLIPEITIANFNKYDLTFNLSIKNHGRAEACNIFIYFDSKKIKLLSQNSISLIEKNGLSIFKFYLSEVPKEDSTPNLLKEYYTINFHITYCDIFQNSSCKKYSINFKASIIVIDKNPIAKIDSINYTFI